jgi:hypothetical protein
MKPTLLQSRSLLTLSVLFTAALRAQPDEDYQLGRGLVVSDWLTVGSYFSTEYKKTDHQDEFLVDDLALLLYGEAGGRFSYMLELESVEPFIADFENDASSTNFPPTIERLYVDYKFSDQVAVRMGKQITPVGYWNLQPINVLRETTSNPLYSKDVFPKFLTGVDVYGFAPFGQDLSYHVYLQNSRDMDENNINLKIDSHYGVALEQVLPRGWKLGGSYGQYGETTHVDTRYLQLNSRYDTYRFSFITEAAISIAEDPAGSEYKAKSLYAQAEFRFTPQHALIGRAEYQHDRLVPGRAQRIGILGYSYRPVYPVSLKVEHQWHDDAGMNGLMASFSVLF